MMFWSITQQLEEQSSTSQQHQLYWYMTHSELTPPSAEYTSSDGPQKQGRPPTTVGHQCQQTS